MGSEGDEVLTLNDEAEDLGSFSGFSSLLDSDKELTASTSVHKNRNRSSGKKGTEKMSKKSGRSKSKKI